MTRCSTCCRASSSSSPSRYCLITVCSFSSSLMKPALGEKKLSPFDNVFLLNLFQRQLSAARIPRCISVSPPEFGAPLPLNCWDEHPGEWPVSYAHRSWAALAGDKRGLVRDLQEAASQGTYRGNRIHPQSRLVFPRARL